MRNCNAELLSLKKVAASLSLTPGLKSELGRLQILRTTAWKYRSHGCRGKRKRRAMREKRGKRAGLIAKMRAGVRRPPISSLFLSYVRALDNKMDLFRLCLGQEELRNCCVMVLVETWLKDNMPDSAFQLDERIFFRSDRNNLSGKTRGPPLAST